MNSLLNFDPNRGLGFEVGRALDFDPARTLGFRSSRNLGFNANRDLGFGRRGVVFREPVCPRCGATIGPDDASCRGCVATSGEHSARTTAVSPSREPPREEGTAPPGLGQTPAAATAKATTYRFCPYCGVRMRAGDESCWNCRSRVSGSVRVTRMPVRTAEPVSREWRQGREG